MPPVLEREGALGYVENKEVTMREGVFEQGPAFSLETAARRVGVSGTFVTRLVHQGLIDTIENERDEVQLPESSVNRLRGMRRLHRDLGVNFAGAAVILDLVARLDGLNKQVTELQREREDTK